MNIISWSGGKDSTATVILAHLHNIPVDYIIFSEVMFDKNISGELPEHISFVHHAKSIFECWGFKVLILHDEHTYSDFFFTVNSGVRTPDHKGMYYGFPMAKRCIVNSCKVKPIRKFLANYPNAIQFLGIAIDEPERLARLKPNCRSLLAEFGYSEIMAFNLCKEYDLLSPVYSSFFRGGCWFCPNASCKQLQYLRANHYDLYSKLLDLERVPNKVGYCFNTLTKFSILDFEKGMKERDYFLSLLDSPVERGGAS